jgi:hypothetical protein
MAEYNVDLIWDAEALVWVATSEDIPGLALESGSLDALIERIRFAVPELLELNGIIQKEYPVRFRSERLERIAI